MLKSVPIRIFELIVEGLEISAADNELLKIIERKNNPCWHSINTNIGDQVNEKHELVNLKIS